MKPFRNQKIEGTEVVLNVRTLPGTRPFWEEKPVVEEPPPHQPPPIKRWREWFNLLSTVQAFEPLARYEGEAPRRRENGERPL